MNWRTWSFQKLQSTMTALSLPATSVFAGGALSAVPSDYPFIVYRIQDSRPRVKDGFDTIRDTTTLEAWFYDMPGSYDRIDTMVAQAKAQLVGQVSSPGAVCCEWVGVGGELADDEFKAILKVATFNLIGAS